MATVKKTFGGLLLSALLGSALFGCGQKTVDEAPQQQITGALLPHHLLVDYFIDDFYQDLSQQQDFDTVILLSPNHFHYGFGAIQSTKELDFKSGSSGDADFVIPAIDRQSVEFLQNQGLLTVEPKYFAKEHGVTVHLSYIKKYFQHATVIPITLKEETSQQRLKALVDEILELPLHRVLVVASIDFSHYAQEENALQDDERLIGWLQAWSKNPSLNTLEKCSELGISSAPQSEAVAMDSPETLWTFLYLLEQSKTTSFHFLRRTSTASLTNIKTPADNTSHIFALFTK